MPVSITASISPIRSRRIPQGSPAGSRCGLEPFHGALRRLVLMSAFVSKLLILTSAVLLALPPGWCCATPSQKPVDTPAKQPAHSCCQHQKQTPTTSQEPAPSQPPPKCYCEKDLVSPTNPEKVSLDLTFSIPVASPDTPVVEVGSAGAGNIVSPASWPPLHV